MGGWRGVRRLTERERERENVPDVYGWHCLSCLSAKADMIARLLAAPRACAFELMFDLFSQPKGFNFSPGAGKST